MTPAEALRIMAAAVDATWNGKLDSPVSAGEVSNQLGLGDGRGPAQTMGRKLAQLERAGLVESRHQGWGKMWRLAPAARDLLEPLA